MEMGSDSQDNKLNYYGGINGHVYPDQISKENERIYQKTKRQRKRQKNSTISECCWFIRMYSIFSDTLWEVQQFSVVTNFV
jgi:hypothetical protein